MEPARRDRAIPEAAPARLTRGGWILNLRPLGYERTQGSDGILSGPAKSKRRRSPTAAVLVPFGPSWRAFTDRTRTVAVGQTPEPLELARCWLVAT